MKEVIINNENKINYYNVSIKKNNLSEFLNVVYYCDCLKILEKIPNKSIDLIIIDPPYYKKMLKDGKNNRVNGDNQGVTFNNYIKGCKKGLKQCKRILKDNGSLYIFADTKQSAYTQIEADKLFKLKNIIFGVKPNSLQKKVEIIKLHIPQ